MAAVERRPRVANDATERPFKTTNEAENTMTDLPARPAQILREPEVHRLTGLSRTTRWRLAKRGMFPAPRQISPGAIGWLAHEIDAWLAARDVTSAMAHAAASPSQTDAGNREISR